MIRRLAIVIIILSLQFTVYGLRFTASAQETDDSSQFITLTDAVPDAILEIRYFSTYNFAGTRIDGYESPTALLTKRAAEALRAVSDELCSQGYRLKIYDAYRPQKAVDHFVRWAADLTDTKMKPYFYPDLDKSVLFDQGYIAEKSGHTRGSTVDLTLFDMQTGKELDMGGTFDWFGPESHPDFCGNPDTGEYTGDNSKSPVGRSITAKQFANRMILRNAMLAHGFKPIDTEWWHFTLANEPFPNTYFTFPVRQLNNSAAHAQEMQSLSLRNGNMEMNVINYGARIQTLKFAGQDMVLGFDTLSHYTQKKQNFGATVGRYIGRIIGGKLPYCYLDETPTATKRPNGLRNGAKDPTKKSSPCRGQKRGGIQLQVGSNGDCSHGGTPGFSQQYWTFTSHNDSTCALRFVSPDGENGFPGELTLDVTYTLQHDALRIDYSATTTKPTVLNPSNHSFFNLSANLGETVLNELLWINGDSTALYNSNKQVTGTLASVTGTPFDFRKPTTIGERINADNEQLKVTKGYDHCYRLNNSCPLVTPVARLSDLSTGVSMEVFTTEPAMQIYTANSHNGSLKGKQGIPYIKQNAICFETMHFPDSPNNPQWPSTLLLPGETFHSTTIYRFSILSE